MLLTKKERNKSPENNTPSPYRGWGNNNNSINKKTLLSQGNRAMPQLFFSV